MSPMVCIPELVARAYIRGLLPKRVAARLFWELAPRSNCLESAVLEAPIRFAGTELVLELPLRSRLNWLLLFEGFGRTGDGPILAELCRRARAADCVVDVGVNVGLYLYHAVVCCPGTVLGVEANGELARLVNRNLAANGLTRAEVVHAAASDGAGEAVLFLGHDDLVSSLEETHIASFGGAAGSERVRAVALDDLLDERGLIPGLIKIDVEGHELSVLRGARRTLESSRPALILEATSTTFPAVHELLTSLGYTGRRYTHDGSVPEDGLTAPEDRANYLYEVVGEQLA
jgi:FkbM family methyltransferase